MVAVALLSIKNKELHFGAINYFLPPMEKIYHLYKKYYKSGSVILTGSLKELI